MMDSRQHYEAAVQLHQQGRLADAEQRYRAVLAAQPKHPGALHGLGVLCVQTDRLDEAFGLLDRAATANPKDPLVHNHLGSC